jgi:hypothetical protein
MRKNRSGGARSKGLKVSNAEMDAIAITGDDFHPEWNYTIAPRKLNEAIVLT